MKYNRITLYNSGLSPEELKKNPSRITKSLLKRVFSYLKPYSGQMILAVLAIRIAALLDLTPSILTGRIIDEGFIDRNFDKIVFYAVLSFAVLFITNLINLLQTYLNTRIAQRISIDLRNNLYAH